MLVLFRINWFCLWYKGYPEQNSFVFVSGNLFKQSEVVYGRA